MTVCRTKARESRLSYKVAEQGLKNSIAHIIIFVLYIFPVSVYGNVSDTLTAVSDTVNIAELDSAFMRELRIRALMDELLGKYTNMATKEEMRMPIDGFAPFISGMITTVYDKDFREIPSIFKSCSSMTDKLDYIPAFTPLAAAWIMKAAGVQSRSKIQRMVTANAMAFALTVGLSQGLKYGVNETRPNGEPRGLPSGHAALAFASATILDREYGYVSPWISIGGYACAAGTQVLRIRHNAHWMNELTLGAALGIVSTNLAYFITDRIFGEKGINAPELRRRDMIRLLRFMNQPSGFHFITGTELGDRRVTCDDGYTIRLNSAFNAGVEYDHFFDESWSMDAVLRMGTLFAKYDVDAADRDLPRFSEGAQMDIYHACLAGRYSLPIVPIVRVGLRGLVGARYTTRCLELPATVRPEVGGGVMMEIFSGKQYVTSVMFDYSYAFASFMRNRFFIGTTMKIML